MAEFKVGDGSWQKRLDAGQCPKCRSSLKEVDAKTKQCTMCGLTIMEKNFGGMTRIIRILDEELTELMSAGLYREAEKTRLRLETYIDMRNKALELSKGTSDE